MPDLLAIALRISVMYVYALTVLRLSGKRTFDSLSPFDFLITVVIGDVFDDIFWAEVPLAKGLVAFTVVILLHMAVSVAVARSQAARKLVEGTPTEVIRAGKLVPAGLALERTPAATVAEQLRLLGEDDLKEVELASWEPGGHLSLLKRDPAQEVKKQDVPRLMKLGRQA